MARLRFCTSPEGGGRPSCCEYCEQRGLELEDRAAPTWPKNGGRSVLIATIPGPPAILPSCSLHVLHLPCLQHLLPHQVGRRTLRSQGSVAGGS
jgi:hypothetical protein